MIHHAAQLGDGVAVHAVETTLELGEPAALLSEL
jgi:hypothetical protein